MKKQVDANGEARFIVPMDYAERMEKRAPVQEGLALSEIPQQGRPSVPREESATDPQARDPLNELANIIAKEDPFREPAATTDPTRAALEAIKEAIARVPRVSEGKFDAEKFTAGIEKAFADINRLLGRTSQKVTEPPRLSEPPSVSKKRA